MMSLIFAQAVRRGSGRLQQRQCRLRLTRTSLKSVGNLNLKLVGFGQWVEGNIRIE